MTTSSELEKVSESSEYSVSRLLIDGGLETVCNEVPIELAVDEFYRCSNNVSAISGIVKAVFITDGFEHVKLAWVMGRGYTFDGGDTYQAQPYNEH